MKILVCTFLFLMIFNCKIDAQSKIDKAKIDSLNQVIIILMESQNNIGIVNTILEILKINPDDTQAQNQLSSMVKAYYYQMPESVLNESFSIIKIKSKLPIIQLLVHYYKINDVKRIQELIYFIVGSPNINLKINPEFLYSLDINSNIKIFRDILTAIAPHILPEKISDYILLNYLVDPDQSLANLVQKLNLKLEDINLCTDSSEIIRIKKNYFVINPNPSEDKFEKIKSNLTDCIKLQDPLWRVLYNYQRNKELLVNELLKNQNNFRSPYKIDLHLLATLNFTTNLKLARIIVKTVSNFINKDTEFNNLSELEFCKLKTLFHFCEVNNQFINLYEFTNAKVSIINLYNYRLFDYLDFIINQPKVDSTYLDLLSIEEIKKFDTSIDTTYAKKIIGLIADYMALKSLKKYDDEFLYELNKLCYSFNIYCPKLSIELVERINSVEVDYSNIVRWGISCVLNNDEDRAKRLFNTVKSFGDRFSIEFLNTEVKYWKNIGLHSELFNEIEKIETYSINNNQLLTTQQNKVDNQIIDIKNVTEKNYFALIIGVENYLQKDMKLNFPLRDTKKLREILVTEYTFEESNVITLSDPKRTQIFDAFGQLRKKLTLNDNLLIFYAGHGHWDEDLEQGYWLPSDALSKDKTNWISNAEIIDLIKGVKSKHTLLIADACFSGSIFITRKAFHEIDKSLELAYSKKSRNGITSGANTPVPDKSVFIEMFIKKLQQNKEKYLIAEQMYLDFRDNVTNNSQVGQRPLFGELDGNEGGEFIFIRK